MFFFPDFYQFDVIKKQSVHIQKNRIYYLHRRVLQCEEPAIPAWALPEDGVVPQCFVGGRSGPATTQQFLPG